MDSFCVKKRTIETMEARLFDSVGRNDLAGVQQILATNPSVANTVDAQGTTALMIAAGRGYVEIIDALIKAGANVNAKSKIGTTALILAITEKHPEGVPLLLAAGADVNAISKLKNTALLEAINNKDAPLVEMLIKARANVNLKGNRDETPLIAAVIKNQVAIAEMLIKAGADVRAKDKYSHALTYAINIAKNPALVDMLIKAGANVNETKVDFMATPLMGATNLNENEIANEIARLLLAAGANVNAKDEDNVTPLFFAIEGKNVELVDMLIKAGADVNAQEAVGSTPLMWAVENKITAAGQIITLLLAAGADVNKKSESGTTVLMMAAANPKGTEAVQLLLAGNADVNLQNSKGETALMKAARYTDNVEVVNMLLAANADVNIADKEGTTALMFAAKNGRKGIVTTLLLKAVGLKPELRDKNGKTAYDLASTPAIKAMLDPFKPADVPWKGYTQSDVTMFQAIFDSPSDISLCPVCLEYAERTDGCMYMKHKCEMPRHEALYELYKNAEGHIEWCTLCGRICSEHTHYMLSLPTDTKRAELVVVPETETGEFRFFDKDCIKSGGGGHAEKIRRFNRLLHYACELQSEVGKIPDREARTELVEEVWKAADTRNRMVAKIIERKKFDFPCEFPADATQTTRPDTEQELPDIKRPADQAELVPIKHEAPDNNCIIEIGPHEDGRPVFQFQHKQPDGSVYRHEGEYICAADLETLIDSQMVDGKCKINPEKCKALMYPEEIKGIVSEAFYEKYRRLFNKANKVGGRKKYRSTRRAPQGRKRTYRRKFRGGADVPLLRPVKLELALCTPPPKKTGAKRVTRRNRRI